MPDYHNPTGRSMPPELRARTLDLAAAAGHDAHRRRDDGRARHRRPGRTRAVRRRRAARSPIGSVGKTIWGGLRLGWIRADRELIQRASRARFALDLGTPIFEQLILLELLPEYDRILEDRRDYLRAGRDHLVARLAAERCPQWSVPHVEGGLTVWANLGRPGELAARLWPPATTVW